MNFPLWKVTLKNPEDITMAQQRENNTLVESFPSNIIANMYKFEKAPFFELQNTAEREVPSVKF